jgi:hypothetical protein
LSRCGSERESRWKDNHVITKNVEWGTLLGLFPANAAPVTEQMKMKNLIRGSFLSEVESAPGDWKDKTDFFF